jgi:membrane-associated protein
VFDSDIDAAPSAPEHRGDPLETLQALIDAFLHLDKHLHAILADYGGWTYAILFAIIFLETGIVVTPFLPGDSLLFAAGALAATGAALDVHVLFFLLTFAAIAGDTVNYWIGSLVGPRVFTDRVRFLKREHLDRTHRFYEKHGAKTIVLARFVPIVRTFAPFVAGIGSMRYSKFLAYNVAGGILWVAIFVYGGYWIGNLPIVKQNFSLFVVVIILVSVAPIGIDLVRSRMRAPAPPAADVEAGR